MTNWTLKPGLEKKFAAGHPWVFSSDLAHSPKGHEPGAQVKLHDSSGRALAIGYGNPHTLIAFRLLSRDTTLTIDREFWLARLQAASELRRLNGVSAWSHRLCYAEGDGMPGLIIDRYRIDRRGSCLPQHGSQVFVIQSSTAGIDRALGEILAALERLVKIEHESGGASWEHTGIVIANDSKSRQLENLLPEAKRWERPLADIDAGADVGVHPAAVRILIQPPAVDMAPTIFTIDLLGGQKTGFFLDQRVNVAAVANVVGARLRQPTSVSTSRSLRVLDLCCYVGQWGTQLAHLGNSLGASVEVTLVDASQKALDLAVHNVRAHGGTARALKLDILADIGQLANGAFDVVICDPPAFIKKKKDVATGQAAYLKLNREAMKKTAVGGLFFSSSCSGLLEEEDFRRVLGRASSAMPEREIRWTWRGSHSADHPQLPQFPQGTYLKSWLAVFLR